MHGTRGEKTSLDVSLSGSHSQLCAEETIFPMEEVFLDLCVVESTGDEDMVPGGGAWGSR